MEIKSRRNLYTGVNAHLHSHLQNELAGWETFHAPHVVHIGETLNGLLPDHYVIVPEKSLQIRAVDPETGEPVTATRRRAFKPDINIYAVRAGQGALSHDLVVTAPTLTRPAIEAVDHDDALYLRALVIRELSEDGKIGKPVTWIELLSPTNKPPGNGYLQYREKRTAALDAGIVLIEIDYLHQTRSPIPNLSSYPDGETNAYPYTVVVTDPRPTLEKGEMALYGFGVDDPIPVIRVPLAGDDQIALDLGAVYQRTFESYNYFGAVVDYAQQPEQFETYSRDDQERISARMVLAKAEHHP